LGTRGKEARMLSWPLHLVLRLRVSGAVTPLLLTPSWHAHTQFYLYQLKPVHTTSKLFCALLVWPPESVYFDVVVGLSCSEDPES
jgi:hypothetical protein